MEFTCLGDKFVPESIKLALTQVRLDLAIGGVPLALAPVIHSSPVLIFIRINVLSDDLRNDNHMRLFLSVNKGLVIIVA